MAVHIPDRRRRPSDPPDDEIRLPLPWGGTLVCGPGVEYRYGGHLAVVDAAGFELQRWTADEWQLPGEAESVIGAVFGFAQNPPSAAARRDPETGKLSRGVGPTGNTYLLKTYAGGERVYADDEVEVHALNEAGPLRLILGGDAPENPDLWVERHRDHWVVLLHPEENDPCLALFVGDDGRVAVRVLPERDRPVEVLGPGDPNPYERGGDDGAEVEES